MYYAHDYSYVIKTKPPNIFIFNLTKFIKYVQFKKLRVDEHFAN